MRNKTKKSASKIKGQVHEATKTAKENQMEVVAATMVESNEAQIIAVQSDVQEVSTEGDSQVVEGPIGTTEGDASQAQPAEKPAEKMPRVNKRPYISWVTEQLETGKYDRKEMVKQVLRDFPKISKGGIETFLTDALNPKYTHFKERIVTKLPNGKMIFADRVEVVAEAQPTEAVAPPVEVVVATNEIQADQFAE